ncbi:hypothetical protein V8C42DRAFT_307566 [Trichoderma barbatum]
MVHPISPVHLSLRGKRCAASRLRCPITASDALGPTDGQDRQGQGLLHHSTRAAVLESP